MSSVDITTDASVNYALTKQNFVGNRHITNSQNKGGHSRGGYPSSGNKTVKGEEVVVDTVPIGAITPSHIASYVGNMVTRLQYATEGLMKVSIIHLVIQAIVEVLLILLHLK